MIESEVKEAINAGEALRRHVRDETAREEIAAEVAARVVLAIAAGNAAQHEFEKKLTEDDIEPERRLFSLGYVCQLVQMQPAGVRSTMKYLGLKFAESRNEVPYLDAHAMTKVAEYKRRLVAGVEAAK